MTLPYYASRIGPKVSKLLKCPRCSTQFDTETAKVTSSGHVVCPNCSAKLRLRARPAVAAPQPAAEPSSGSVSEEIAIAGLTPGTPEQDGSSGSAPSRSPGSRTREREPDSPLPAGTKLGGFEVRRVLGRGGMATVYKATQLSLNRPVAVKVLAKRFARNPVFVERFDREAGALAGLNHPNIVNIIDKGVIDDNYFFVMELVEGITLDQLLHSVELSEQHYLHIIGEISKALAYVHSRGIIHRDIKPSNILVNRTGVVKVSDFGIAHMTDAEAPQERFGRNATVGTAHYMSPEQATDATSVDQRADIYSLAVTFYKMFTRQLPPAGTGAPVIPASELNPKLPKAVDPILQRAMDPSPDNRFPEVAEFCEALINAFTARTGSDLVGAAAASAASMTESGTFLFNTNLFSSAGGATATAADADFLQSVVAAASAPSSTAVASAAPGVAGTSLLTPPLEIPGLVPDSTSGFGTNPGTSPGSSTSASTPSTPMPFPSPFSAGVPSYIKPPEPEPEPEPEKPKDRSKLYLILAVILTILAAAAFFSIRWWLTWSAYGHIQ